MTRKNLFFLFLIFTFMLSSISGNVKPVQATANVAPLQSGGFFHCWDGTTRDDPEACPPSPYILCSDGSVVLSSSACPAPPPTITCTDGKVVLASGGCPAGTEPIQFTNFAIPTGGSTTGNCESWANACTLKRAIERAKYFVDLHPNMITSINIYVKKGTYKPDPSDPTKSFQLYNGIAIYGGFDGVSTDFAKRDVVANPTILSGDLNGNDGPNFTNMAENSYHVVTGTDLNTFPAASTLLPAILDGFTITGGNAPDNGGGIKLYNSSPSLYRLFFKDNRSSYGGGGVYNSQNSNPRLEGITFFHNYAYEGGGGMYSHFSSPKLFNVTFSGNSTDNWGGGMTNYQSQALLINVTFSGNTTTQPSGYSGAMFTVMDGGPSLPGVWPTMINSIIANSVGGDCLGQFAVAYNNLIESSGTACGLVNGDHGNIVGFDPELSPLAYNGGISQTHAISATSKARNAGTHDVYLAVPNINLYCPTYDQNTTKRALTLADPCDIGATEYTSTPNLAAINAIRYVIPNGATSGDCSSWATACNLEYAMSYARVGDQIWVKKGNYVPSGSSRNASFHPKNGTKLYGGFNGTETSFEQRNPATNFTVLSGDRNGDDISLGNKSDNAYHVVNISELDSTTVLDGFTIINGYADGTDWPDYNGGGIFNYGGNATLNKLYIVNNYASNGGGGMINDKVNSIFITNTTFSNNTANAIGGGGLINWYSNNVILTRSTFSENIANNGAGGAILNTNSSATIAESTISGNFASNGGGLYNDGTVFLRNTIIANSFGGDCVGTLDPSSANNLISDTDSAFNCGLSSASSTLQKNLQASATSNGNIVGVDPLLSDLKNNGGAVPTFGLLAGSPAIDAGAICPSIDQRDRLPNLDGDGDGISACDIGSTEANPIPLPSPWIGSVSISSDKNVVAVGRPHIGSEVASYDGASSGALSAYVPMLFKDAFGGSYDAALYVQNVSGSSANITIKFYDSTGTLSCTKNGTVSSLASKGYWLPSESCLPAGWVGGALVTSDQNIVAIGRPHIGSEVMTYNGFSSGSTSASIPMLFKDAFGGSYDAAFYIQNIHPSNTANLTINFYDSSGALSCTKNDTLSPLASKGYWVPAESCLPTGWVGGVIVTSDQPIVSVGRPHIGSQITTYNGFSSGATSSFIPMLFKDAFGGSYDAAFYLQNTHSSNTANLTIQFYDSAGTLSCTKNDTLAPFASKGFWVPAESCLPAGWVGGVIVTSDQPIVGVGRPHIGAQITTYNGFSSGSSSSFLSMLFKDAFGGSYDSAFYVQNTEASQATVTTSFYDSAGALTCSRIDTIQPKATLGIWVPSATCIP